MPPLGTKTALQKSDGALVPLKPLIKWPGGKRWLVPVIEKLQPRQYDRYIEPFAGGAAIFFGIRHHRPVLADLNRALIETYRAVVDAPVEVAAMLKALENSKEAYYQVRQWIPTSRIEAAVRTLYLARFSFNGIYRVNLKGQFNVPYGHKTWMSVHDTETLNTYSSALSDAILLNEDFETTLKFARKGDFVYVDPPYTVSHNNNGFLKYNERIFSWTDQQNLAEACKAAARRGAFVVVSNADHLEVKKLYKPEFRCRVVERFSSVSASPSGRQHVSECLFISKAPPA